MAIELKLVAIELKASGNWTEASHDCAEAKSLGSVRKSHSPNDRGQPNMKLRFTMYDENPGDAFIYLQQLSHLFSEQACHSSFSFSIALAQLPLALAFQLPTSFSFSIATSFS